MRNKSDQIDTARFNDDSRSKSSGRNIVYAIIGQMTKEILAFIVRTIFIRTLSVEYLGINGLFTNILSFLSLAEMGVGSALIFSMYKPMAERNTEKLKSLMQIYKSAYRIIGIVVILLGISLTPFLDIFIKDKPDIPNLEIIYILYVLNTGATYFFAYKGSIFNADQRAYVVTNNNTVFTIIQSAVRIAVLLLTKNFILYLVLSILTVYIQNFWISVKADKDYPFLQESAVAKLDSSEKKALFRNIGALTAHRIGAVVLNSSDNIVISKFIGIATVGLYSNYSMIVAAITTTFDMVFNALTTSVGNLCAQDDNKKTLDVFNSILLINVWIISFCTICLYNLLTPFVSLWLGSEYTLSNGVVFALCFSTYAQYSIRTGDMFRTASGLFSQEVISPFIQCAINVIISIILSVKFGLVGIFIGTSVAIYTTRFWIAPYVFFKHKLKMSLSLFFKKYALFSCFSAIAFLATKFAVDMVQVSGFYGLAIKLLLSAVIPNVVFMVCTFRTQEFAYCKRLLLNIRK